MSRDKGKSRSSGSTCTKRLTLFFEMAPTALVKKTGSERKSKPAEKKKTLTPPEPVDVSSSDDAEGWEDEESGDESESDKEDDGVDEAGFEKLVRALGDDALNEYDQAHLVALAGDGEDDEDAEEDEELGEVSGSEEGGEEVSEDGDEAEEGDSGSDPEGGDAEGGEPSGDEDVLALDELEDVELHPDAVPRRGVKVIDNKVRVTRPNNLFYLIFCLGCPREDQENHPTRPQTILDRNTRRLIPRGPHHRPRGRLEPRACLVRSHNIYKLRSNLTSIVATNRPFTVSKKPALSLPSTNCHLHVLQTTLPKWSSRTRIWNASASVC